MFGEGAPSAPTARPGKRKGRIGLQLNNTFKRLHSPEEQQLRIVEPAGPGGLEGSWGERGRGGAPGLGQMDPWLPRPARWGDRTNIFPLGLSLFWAVGELEQEMFSLSCPLAGCSFAPPGER